MWTKRVKRYLKVDHTRLLSVGFRSWSRFLAVSLQVTWVIYPAVGCRYFPPGLQLPPQPLRGLLPVSLIGDRGTMGVNSLPKTVTRQRRDCDLNSGLLRLSPARQPLGYRLPSTKKMKNDSILHKTDKWVCEFVSIARHTWHMHCSRNRLILTR